MSVRIIIPILFVGGIIAFLYSKRANAEEKPAAEDNSILDWVPIDFGKYERPYTNVLGDEVSKQMNNPLNIRYNKYNNWVGQIGERRGFVVFSSPEYCYRAATIILGNYAKRGIKTLEQIIRTWAPPSENPTESYINFVVKDSGLYRGQTIDRELYDELFISMTKFEISTFPYSKKLVQNGINLV